MSTPYSAAPTSIPVTVLTHGPMPQSPEVTIVRLEPALHEHVPGTECIACAARSDVRALLFDLLQTSRADGRPLQSVVLDARALRDPHSVAARLDPGTPALGLRDHTVLRSFHLSRVI